MLSLENFKDLWGSEEERVKIMNSFNDFYFPEGINGSRMEDNTCCFPTITKMGDYMHVEKIKKLDFYKNFYRLAIFYFYLKKDDEYDNYSSSNFPATDSYKYIIYNDEMPLILSKKHLIKCKEFVENMKLNFEHVNDNEEVKNKKNNQVNQLVLSNIESRLNNDVENIVPEFIMEKYFVAYLETLKRTEMLDLLVFNLKRYIKQINEDKNGLSVFKKCNDFQIDYEKNDFTWNDFKNLKILTFPQSSMVKKLIECLNVKGETKKALEFFFTNMCLNIINSNRHSYAGVAFIESIFNLKFSVNDAQAILETLRLIKGSNIVFSKDVYTDKAETIENHFSFRGENSLNSIKEILFDNVEVEKEASLSLVDYNYMGESLDELLMILKNNGNKNVLIWGKPGFGKTELVKVLAKEVGKQLININTVVVKSFAKKENTDKDMLKRLIIAKDVSKVIGGQWVIVDEAENILKDASLKGMFNNEIDKKDVTTFWVLNDLNGVNASYVRRFDYILELNEMPFEYRENLAKNKLGDNNKNGLSVKLAHSLKTPAEIINAIQNCKDVGQYEWSLIAKKMSAYQKVLTQSTVGENGGFEIEVKIPEVGKGLDDFAGYDYVKNEILDTFEILKDSERYKKNGAKLPKGLLLMGSAGVGKTLLTKAIANEYQMSLVTAKSTDLASNPERIKYLFDKAKSLAPCIVFIDELDVLGSNVICPDGSVDTAKQKILNSLLVEMDGFDKFEGILTIGATHRSYLLDPNLLRNGRFGHKIRLRKPEKKDRVEIFKHYLVGKNVEELNYENLAKISQGFTSVDVAESVNLALLKSLRNGTNLITQETLNEAIDEIYFGVKANGLPITNKEKFMTAIHESGHALISMKNNMPIKRATIRPHENFLGMVQVEKDEAIWSNNKEDVLKMIEVFIAGMLAEKLIFGKFSNGNSSDLLKTRNILVDFYLSSGASKTLGIFGLGLGMISDERKKELEDEFISVMQEKEEVVTKWLTENRNKLIDFAKLLLDNRSLDYEQIKTWKDSNFKIEDVSDESIESLMEMAYKAIVIN